MIRPQHSGARSVLIAWLAKLARRDQRQQSRSGLPFETDVDYKEFGLIVELDDRESWWISNRSCGVGLLAAHG